MRDCDDVIKEKGQGQIDVNSKTFESIQYEKVKLQFAIISM